MGEVKRIEVPSIDWEFFVKLSSGDWVGYKLERRELVRYRCQHCDRVRIFVMPEGATIFSFSCGMCKGENKAPLLKLMTREEFEKEEAEIQRQLDELLEKQTALLKQHSDAKRRCSHLTGGEKNPRPEVFGPCPSCGNDTND